MKRAKVSPLNSDQNRKVLIDAEQYSGLERIELICNYCHRRSEDP